MKALKVIIFALLLGAATAQAVPPPRGYVSDYMNLLDPGSRSQITQALEAIERSTGAEIAVVIQDSIPGDSTIEEMALAYLSEWKVGKKGEDNGLVLLVVPSLHTYRFETGRGLEGDLPDGLLGQIGREELIPFFKSGDYGDGILSAVVRMGNILGADMTVKAPRKKQPALPGLGALIFLIIILLLIFGRGGRGRGGRGIGSDLLWLLILGSMGNRRGGGGFGGGGFGGGGFGGGFGGFGGGGGGAGGGATGRW